MREFTIGKNDVGQRLDRFLGKAMPLLPPALLQKYIRIKRVKCNGARCQRDQRLREGEELSRCRHLETGRELYILNEYLRRGEGGLWCEDSTDYRLPVSPGDLLTVVRKTKRGFLCKKEGTTGWYYGRMSDIME